MNQKIRACEMRNCYRSCLRVGLDRTCNVLWVCEWCCCFYVFLRPQVQLRNQINVCTTNLFILLSLHYNSCFSFLKYRFQSNFHFNSYACKIKALHFRDTKLNSCPVPKSLRQRFEIKVPVLNHFLNKSFFIMRCLLSDITKKHWRELWFVIQSIFSRLKQFFMPNTIRFVSFFHIFWRKTTTNRTERQSKGKTLDTDNMKLAKWHKIGKMTIILWNRGKYCKLFCFGLLAKSYQISRASLIPFIICNSSGSHNIFSYAWAKFRLINKKKWLVVGSEIFRFENRHSVTKPGILSFSFNEFIIKNSSSKWFRLDHEHLEFPSEIQLCCVNKTQPITNNYKWQ